MTWADILLTLHQAPEPPTWGVQEALDDLILTLESLPQDDLGAPTPRSGGGSAPGAEDLPVHARTDVDMSTRMGF